MSYALSTLSFKINGIRSSVGLFISSKSIMSKQGFMAGSLVQLIWFSTTYSLPTEYFPVLYSDLGTTTPRYSIDGFFFIALNASFDHANMVFPFAEMRFDQFLFCICIQGVPPGHGCRQVFDQPNFHFTSRWVDVILIFD